MTRALSTCAKKSPPGQPAGSFSSTRETAIYSSIESNDAGTGT
jgi:hypothetical protein